MIQQRRKELTMLSKFKEKECEMCEVSYAPTSSRQRYCEECGVTNKKQYDKQYNKQYNKQYYQRPGNKEKRKQYQKQYYQRPGNKEKKKQQNKQYYEENKKEIAERYDKKQRSKRWHQENKEQDTACVYLILNTSNGYIYIGETVAFARRTYQHKTRLKAGRHKNSLLQKDYDKHGPEAFEFAIIKEINKENFQTEEQLKEHLRTEEAKMILKEVDEGKELYNISLNPEYVVQVLRERLKQSTSIGSIGNA
jgi:predicted GIY-YIG superfamily endonuclease